MVEYEWDVEELDAEGEIVSHHGFPSYALAQTFAEESAARNVTCLVALVQDADGYRAWAYIDFHTSYGLGILPDYFQDAYGNVAGAVPKRFHREVALY